MPLGGNKILGLAVGERSILACELARAGASFQATRLAEFDYPAATSPDEPPALGKALGEFLRHNKFSARRAVVGLPLKWAVVKPKEVPPADASTVAGLLLLQAEREFALEPQDLVFEYAGESDPAAARTVLLLAVQRRRVDSVVAMAEAAGLGVGAVTLSAVALAHETGRQLAHGGAVLHVTPGSAELTIHHSGQPRVLRHLRAPAAGAPPTATALAEGPPPEGGRLNESAAAYTPELRQVLSMMPQNGTAAPTELVVWDGVGLGEAKGRWGDVLGVSVRDQSIESLGVTVPGDGASGNGRYASAVAVALEGLRSGGPSTDLLHSRLVPRKEPRVGRWTVWAAVLAITFVGAAAFAIYDLTSQRGEVAALSATLDKLKPDVANARTSIERITHAQRWTGTEPRALALMRDLTNAFPEGGRVWATNLNVQADGRATLTGRAAGSEGPLALFKRMRESGKFTDVQYGGDQPADRRSGTEITFTINFRYPALTQ